MKGRNRYFGPSGLDALFLCINQGRRASRLPLAIIFRAFGVVVRRPGYCVPRDSHRCEQRLQLTTRHLCATLLFGGEVLLEEFGGGFEEVVRRNDAD